MAVSSATEVLRHAEGIVKRAYESLPDNWADTVAHEAEWMVGPLTDLAGMAPTEVLDIGCGYGTFAIAASILGHDVTAVDWFTTPPEYPGVRWVRQNVEGPMALPRGPYGVVVMLEVLEHLNCHPASLLARVRNALAPGGVFLGSTPTPGIWPERREWPELAALSEWHEGMELRNEHIRLYRPPEVRELLSLAGFVVNRCGPDIDALAGLKSCYRYHWEARRPA
jgi:SAM-dependent methyltransferase